MTMYWSFQILFATKFLFNCIAAALLFSILFFCSTQAQETIFPQTEISNGLITAKIYLPDAEKGYYRSTRFDWSGVVYSLRYNNHEFYSKWYDRIDPKVINWVHMGPEIVSGSCSGLYGPVEEFESPLGWNDAKIGGTFIKIGVGVLRKDDEKYNWFKPYEVLTTGKWSVKTSSDGVEFTQELSDSNSGYSYVYHKVVLLVKDKALMVIEHSLRNTGKLAIKSNIYNHNFVVLDNQPPGPDFTFKVPFQIQGGKSLHKELADVSGNEIVFKKQLAGEDEAVVFINGFGDSAKDNEITIENKKVGAGLKTSCNRQLIREFLWSIRSVLAIEPYIAIDVQPGKVFTWKNTIEYYTLPSNN